MSEIINPIISEDILSSYGAQLHSFGDKDLIFSSNTEARNYYQIQHGSIRMFNLHENGKEFVQGEFYDGESFAEPPLFGDFPYPASAVATKKSSIFVLPKDRFLQLLKDHFELQLQFMGLLSRRLSYKAMILKEISIHSPEHRILTLVDFMKAKYGNDNTYEVDLTRQQIANLTGLRVETVIRAFKQLESQGEIEIINRKIYR
ncbi:Crp/Fnr family transcriptional regulator [Aureisphaera galaxeae]|uniref:Crp/Fnr family transcriptional regulator n=1 Tax=Aureisphaera galaxeae TaxID=1538023 RepID=UPI0023509BF9|nr:Crp/Fnr family transcriptional regulator [Aureisphaera galaxeae]MDC8003821.1 Crp/Fnr family transcriptional regulator [Aureisphaera galaxeae]